jgi:hypothetical protein
VPGKFLCRIIRIRTHYNIPTADVLLRLLGVKPVLLPRDTTEERETKTPSG